MTDTDPWTERRRIADLVASGSDSTTGHLTLADWLLDALADLAAARAEVERLREVMAPEQQVLDEVGITWQSRARRLAAEVADLRDRLAAGHVVHVTAEPVAEDVVWCDECEEWVTAGPVALGDADTLAEVKARAKAEALREAAREFAEGEWAEAWGADGVCDDVSAVQSTERWFNRYADRIEGATDERPVCSGCGETYPADQHEGKLHDHWTAEEDTR